MTKLHHQKKNSTITAANQKSLILVMLRLFKKQNHSCVYLAQLVASQTRQEMLGSSHLGVFL